MMSDVDRADSLMAKRPKAPVIVDIRLGINSDGSIARDVPFVVIADDADRCGRYVNEPAVIAQLVSAG